MLESKIKEIGEIKFPKFSKADLYMYPIDLGAKKVVLPKNLTRFNKSINEMLKQSPIKSGIAFVTIDARIVEKETTHRRGGPHVDGNFIFSWPGSDDEGGSGGWLTGVKGRILSPKNHKLQYCNKKGGMLIAATHSACKAWIGKYKARPKQGGNCAHMKKQLNKLTNVLLKPNVVYLGNSTCIHESLPIENTIKRTLIRITLPPKFVKI